MQAQPPFGPGRLPGFLLLSVLLHGAWLALPGHRPPGSGPARDAPPLQAYLAAPPAPAVVEPPAPIPPARVPRRGRAVTAPPAFPLAPAEPTPPPAPGAGPPADAPAIDLQAARATARTLAREPRPPPGPGGPGSAPPPVARVAPMEAAVARALRRDTVEEVRGAGGEWVEKRGRTRCVTPIRVPHFMAGKSLLTLCEVAKE